jgi:hypothetical protein
LASGNRAMMVNTSLFYEWRKVASNFIQ